MRSFKNFATMLGVMLFVALGNYSPVEAANEALKTTFPEPRRAYGRDEMKAHIGVELGYAEPGERYDATAEYGINFGFQPFIPFGLGAEVSTFRSSEDIGVVWYRTKAMINGTYNFGGPVDILKNSYVGTGFGSVFDTVGDQSATYFGINLLAGLDFPLGDNELGRNSFTLGAMAKYLLVPEEDVQDSFALNAQLKYWY